MLPSTETVKKSVQAGGQHVRLSSLLCVSLPGSSSRVHWCTVNQLSWCIQSPVLESVDAVVGRSLKERLRQICAILFFYSR